ncbi:hypothetical protein JKP88DRAFT_353727 [Tribonema minus]|uniref:EGF-like domain-containing protein n=1 Tax=Tribonema minus TaxID=303371 RepID=A0A836CIR7_9STRA|nr:hypothetical protein JKP88DRAFT_353727 [Tribonema minus]
MIRQPEVCQSGTADAGVDAVSVPPETEEAGSKEQQQHQQQQQQQGAAHQQQTSAAPEVPEKKPVQTTKPAAVACDPGTTCNEHGRCEQDGSCKCDNPWTGADCSQDPCAERSSSCGACKDAAVLGGLSCMWDAESATCFAIALNPETGKPPPFECPAAAPGGPFALVALLVAAAGGAYCWLKRRRRRAGGGGGDSAPTARYTPVPQADSGGVHAAAAAADGWEDWESDGGGEVELGVRRGGGGPGTPAQGGGAPRSSTDAGMKAAIAASLHDAPPQALPLPQRQHSNGSTGDAGAAPLKRGHAPMPLRGGGAAAATGAPRSGATAEPRRSSSEPAPTEDDDLFAELGIEARPVFRPPPVSALRAPTTSRVSSLAALSPEPGGGAGGEWDDGLDDLDT